MRDIIISWLLDAGGSDAAMIVPLVRGWLSTVPDEEIRANLVKFRDLLNVTLE